LLGKAFHLKKKSKRLAYPPVKLIRVPDEGTMPEGIKYPAARKLESRVNL
jgi:hypothetical protein